MTSSVHYPTLRSAGEHLQDVMDAAFSGLPVSVTRGEDQLSVITTNRLAQLLLEMVPSNARAIPETEGWSIILPQYSISAGGETFDAALDEMVLALRDYAQAWSERLRVAPKHEANWALVQLVEIASDEQLKSWLA